MTSATAKPKRAKTTPIKKAFHAEAIRQAELTAAAYEILSEIEELNAATEIDKIVISDTEWRIFHQVGLIEDRNRDSLRGVLRSQRNTRKKRKELLDMGDRDAIEQRLAVATKAKTAIKEQLQDLDPDEQSEFATTFKGLRGKLKDLERQHTEAGDDLNRLDSLRKQLERNAPKPLIEFVDNTLCCIRHSEAGRRHHAMKIESKTLGKILCPANVLSPLQHVRISFPNGGLDGFLKLYCDESYVEVDAHGRTLDQDKLFSRVKEMRDEYLPNLIAERDHLKSELDVASEAARSPLTDWAYTGTLSMESLLTNGQG